MVGLAVLGGAAAQASTFVQLDLPGLTALSDGAVHATVAGKQSYWNSRQTMIFTDVTLDVISPVLGANPGQVTVRVPGGEVDGLVVAVDGAPQLQVGEEVVVFLGRWKDGSPMIAGYEQGVSRVERRKTMDGDSLRGSDLVLQGGVAAGLTLDQLGTELARIRTAGPQSPRPTLGGGQ